MHCKFTKRGVEQDLWSGYVGGYGKSTAASVRLRRMFQYAFSPTGVSRWGPRTFWVVSEQEETNKVRTTVTYPGRVPNFVRNGLSLRETEVER